MISRQVLYKTARVFSFTALVWLLNPLQVSAALAATSDARQADKQRLDYQAIEEARRTNVARNIHLSKTESSRFWALYDDYRTATSTFDARRTELLMRLSKQVDDLSDGEGRLLMKDALTLEKERQEEKQRYLELVAEILSGDRLFRYYQIETKLDAQARASWTRLIPLAVAP